MFQMSVVEYLVGQSTTDEVQRVTVTWMCVKPGHARVVSHRNVVKVDVVAILLNAVIIMTLEDVIPCVVAVTAWWEKGS
jgi:hypothetical protein